MYLIDFVAIIAATGALVNAWLHKGGLFEEWRDRISVWGTTPRDGYVSDGMPTRWDICRDTLAQLLNCRVCLSYHAAFWLLVLFYSPSLWLPPPWSLIVKLPIYSLAATRFSLLIGLYVDRWGLEDDPEND